MLRHSAKVQVNALNAHLSGLYATGNILQLYYLYCYPYLCLECLVVLCFCNHVNLITISNHHHHQNSDPRHLQLSTTSSVLSIHSDIFLSQSLSYSEVITTPSSLSLAYLMSMLFGNNWWISPWTLYSTFQPLSLCFRVWACTEWPFIFIICLFHVSEFPCSL